MYSERRHFVAITPHMATLARMYCVCIARACSACSVRASCKQARSKRECARAVERTYEKFLVRPVGLSRRSSYETLRRVATSDDDDFVPL